MRILLTAIVLLLTISPVGATVDESKVEKYARSLTFNNDPYEKCRTLSEQGRSDRISALKCSSASVDTVLWFVSFDLGRWEGAVDRFALFGGEVLETVGRPRLEVSSCRRGCSYYSTAMLKIPMRLMLSEEVRDHGLTVKAFGGPQPIMMKIEPERVLAILRGLAAHGFIEDNIPPPYDSRKYVPGD